MNTPIEGYAEKELRQVLNTYLEVRSTRRAAQMLGLSRTSFRRRLEKARKLFGIISDTQTVPSVQVEETVDSDSRVVSVKGVRTLKQLLQFANIDLDKWIVVKKVINKWDAVSKDGVIDLWQVKAWLERRPEFFVSPVTPVSSQKRLPPEAKNAALQRALIIPDAQVGFRRQENGTLVPLHDRAAMDLVLQACAKLAPDKIIILGDMLDLAPWSTKFSTEPGLRFTTQHSLVELFWWLSTIRTTCPSTEIIYLEGNHENRIERALKEKVDEALNIRPANELDKEPSLSIPRLLSLSDIDVEYRGPYGASYWLWDEVRIHHGHVVRGKSGGTTSAILNNSSHSQIVGHIHRVESHSKTIQVAGGRKIITAMSPGCLCRLDGVVPAFAGQPNNWQQGIGLVHKTKGGVSLMTVPIVNGTMVLSGEVLVAEDYTETLSKESGLKF